MQPAGEQPSLKSVTDQGVGAPGVTVVWGAGAAEVVLERRRVRREVVAVEAEKRILDILVVDVLLKSREKTLLVLVYW